jgi:hypothetical protein
MHSTCHVLKRNKICIYSVADYSDVNVSEEIAVREQSEQESISSEIQCIVCLTHNMAFISWQSSS